jgi:RNA polymerase sigma-70 factor (ECF subfamily)
MNWDEAYAEHHAALLRLATRLLSGNVQTAADVAATTWAKAWQHRQRLDVAKPVGPWLRTILRRTVIDHKRRQVMPNRSEDNEPAADLLTDLLEVAELLEQVAALPAANKAAIEAVHLRGLSFREAAEALGLAKSTLQNRLNRGLDLLRGVA